MPIEEKQKPLEFSFISNKDKKIKFGIVYDCNEECPISITDKGLTIRLPVELFEEVIEFLQKKGILKSKVSSGVIAGIIPTPVIQKKNRDEEEIIPASIDVDPLTSFDISLTTKPSKKEEDTKERKSTGPVFSESETDKDKEIISARVKGDDPVSAKKAGAAQRKLKKESESKKVKRY